LQPKAKGNKACLAGFSFLLLPFAFLLQEKRGPGRFFFPQFRQVAHNGSLRARGYP